MGGGFGEACWRMEVLMGRGEGDRGYGLLRMEIRQRGAGDRGASGLWDVGRDCEGEGMGSRTDDLVAIYVAERRQ